MEAQLDPVFKEQVDSGRIPGIAAVAYDVSGKALFKKGYGHVVAGDSSSPDVTPDTPAMIWSCTKLVTCVAILQLVEQGKIKSIDDPAENYVPEIADIKRLHGFNDDGSPKLEAPKKKITVLHLLTHTAGFAYDFFNQETLQWRIAKEQPPCAYVTRSEMEDYTTPLIFEPGERWEYGVNIDWLGMIVHKVSGLRLDEYIKKNITEPLGLKSTGLTLSDEQEKRFFKVHTKTANGELAATEMRLVNNPPIVPGGHFLCSTCDEYAQFLLALLNNGTNPNSNAKILEPDTVKKYVFKDMLPAVGCPGVPVGDVPSTMPPVTNTGSFLPGLPKGWSCGAMILNEENPNGRNK